MGHASSVVGQQVQVLDVRAALLEPAPQRQQHTDSAQRGQHCAEHGDGQPRGGRLPAGEQGHEPGHAVKVVPGTLLHRIVGSEVMHVNTSHHQAVRAPGPHAIVDATAEDGVIEGIEDGRYRFCLGVQWHPEFHIDAGDRRIFDALVAACRS